MALAAPLVAVQHFQMRPTRRYNSEKTNTPRTQKKLPLIPLNQMSPRVIPPHIRSQIVRYLELHWTPAAISQQCQVCLGTVYNIRKNLQLFGQATRPALVTRGRPRRLTTDAKTGLEEYVRLHPCSTQEEMVAFLLEEFHIQVSQPTICRALRGLEWSGKKEKRVARRRKTTVSAPSCHEN